VDSQSVWKPTTGSTDLGAAVLRNQQWACRSAVKEHFIANNAVRIQPSIWNRDTIGAPVSRLIEVTGDELGGILIRPNISRLAQTVPHREGGAQNREQLEYLAPRSHIRHFG
jgi:hypothetical protein